MRTAEDYRQMAADCRTEMQRTQPQDVKKALKVLAEAYERQADVMDGKRID
jgi:hypothetical protein